MVASEQEPSWNEAGHDHQRGVAPGYAAVFEPAPDGSAERPPGHAAAEHAVGADSRSPGNQAVEHPDGSAGHAGYEAVEYADRQAGHQGYETVEYTNGQAGYATAK